MTDPTDVSRPDPPSSTDDLDFDPPADDFFALDDDEVALDADLDAPPEGWTHATPVLDREEYVEQAYLFRTLRERLGDGQPAQDILDTVKQELLATTKLTHAMTLMISVLRHRGELADAFDRLNHYFTPFQAHLVRQAESDKSRLLFTQALLILEREAEYRADKPTIPGLFIFQIEALSRNRLGYVDGLNAMQGDGIYDQDWVDFMDLVKKALGWRELAELIYARSEQIVIRKRNVDPSFDPTFAVLFGEKEGKIAAANVGKDPKYLFSTLQRQLNYPMVPRPPRRQPQANLVADLIRRMKTLETKIGVLEGEINGTLDLEQFYVNNANKSDDQETPNPNPWGHLDDLD